MPESSPRLRAMFEDDSAAADVLEAAGWTCVDFTWQVPADESTVTDREWDALQYLCEEWDYGCAHAKVPTGG